MAIDITARDTNKSEQGYGARERGFFTLLSVPSNSSNAYPEATDKQHVPGGNVRLYFGQSIPLGVSQRVDSSRPMLRWGEGHLSVEGHLSAIHGTAVSSA